MKRKTHQITIGQLTIGGGRPVAVQSMTNAKTWDVKATVRQIRQLEAVGCEIVRVAVPDKESCQALAAIKKRVDIPLVADVHFNYRYALAALEQGVDKIRINPGTMKNLEQVKAVVLKAKEKKVPLRIGVNSGSLHPQFKGEKRLAQALVKSALSYVEFCEKLGFGQIVLSVKASSASSTIEAYRFLAKQASYPLHLGVTEAGTLLSGSIKSAVGLGVLLAEGIGDTIRVSLAADPTYEVRVAYEILQALDLRKRGPQLIACPTCGRCEIDLISLANKVEKRLVSYTVPIKVAVMGCVVNGPGEAKEADIGIAGGKKAGILFKKGRIVKKIPEAKLVDVLIKEIEKL